MFLGDMKAAFGARGKQRGVSPEAAARHSQPARVHTDFFLEKFDFSPRGRRGGG